MRVLAAVALLLCSSSLARAQQVCPVEQLKDPKLTLSDMYAKAEAQAKAWKADAVPVRITNTNMGPLDEQGRSEAWSVTFFSASANANVGITTFRGMFNCYANDGGAGRIPDLKPTFFRDGAKLYALANQNGADYLTQGYTVALGTAAASDRHAMWYLTFFKDTKYAPLTVIVDANTGAVEKVLKQ